MTAGAIKTIVINGASTATPAATLEALLAEQGYAGRKVATALNGAFVAEKQRAETRLVSGDKVEIVSARQGG